MVVTQWQLSAVMSRWDFLATHAKEQAEVFVSRTASDLKEECANLSLPTSGNKADLVTRLVEQQWLDLALKAAAK